MSRSQCAQCQPVEKGNSRLVAAAVSAAAVFEIAGDPPASTGNGMTLILPLPKRRAVSIASVKRERFSCADDDAVLDDLNARAEAFDFSVTIYTNNVAV